MATTHVYAQTNSSGPEPQPVKDWLANHPNFTGCVHTDLKTGESKEVSCIHPELSPMGMYEPQNNRHVMSPLKQFMSGIALKDIACDDDLKLVIKKENNHPVCVKSQSIHNLLARGWASLLSPVTHLAYDASSSLGFDLSINTDTIKSGQAISMDISISNTQSKSLTVPVANNWPIRNYDLSISECSYYPMGIAILNGYYTEQNMSNAFPLSLYVRSGCTIGPLIENYTFQSLSSKTTPECYSTEYSCPGLVVTKSHLSYSGYYDNNNQFHPFNGGTYTIVGGDEWGHLAVQHFVVDNGGQENPEKILGLENDTGIVSLKNQTYYFDTPHYTQDAYVNPIQTSFHDVVFTLFPSGFRGGLPTPCDHQGSGQYYWTDAKFRDSTHELLYIFADSPPCNTIPTMFSNHANPQAGLTFYDGKMKLLVSTNVTDSTEKHNITIQSLGQTPNVFNETDTTKLRVHFSGGSVSINIGSDKFNQTGFFSGNIGHVIKGVPVEVSISDPYDMFIRQYEIPSSNISQDGSFNFTHTFLGKYDQDIYTLDFSYSNQKCELKYYPIIPP